MAANEAERALPEIDGYMVQAILGEGRTGTVYRATMNESHTEVGQTVKEFAIKTYSNNEDGEDGEDGEARQRRFDKEVHFMRLVQGHANVIALHRCLHTPMAIVMSLHESDLFSFVHASSGLSECMAAHIMGGLLRAVRHVHQQGVLHRDIKPENIAVHEPDNSAILLDFDCACLSSDTVAIRERPGTPGYMAPEVILGMPCGTQADMFSLGVVMYYLFGRRNPFHTRPYSASAVFHKTLVDECKFDTRFDHIGALSKQTIRMLLAKLPRKRLSAQDALLYYWEVVSYRARAGPPVLSPLEDSANYAHTRDVNTTAKSRARSERRRRECSVSDDAQGLAAATKDTSSLTLSVTQVESRASLDQPEALVVPLLPVAPEEPRPAVPRPSGLLQRAKSRIANVKASFGSQGSSSKGRHASGSPSSDYTPEVEDH
eukprot:TRINITY_DN66605_c0_g1_i1.p1 TRINITY_DN66605_c0_g1~~TRINITY_DN66605_c0_g1_i1.p1  ORF type:complete len:431 (-),score=49.20 TRINITY_DN66605_c0_g1_i1:401-1693(-)